MALHHPAHSGDYLKGKWRLKNGSIRYIIVLLQGFSDKIVGNAKLESCEDLAQVDLDEGCSRRRWA